MPELFNCPSCSAPLEYSGSGEVVRCRYCGNSVIVPEEVRPKNQAAPVPPADAARAFVSSQQMDEIRQLLHSGQKIEAIKIYREATTLGLKEAKDAVDAIEAADPEIRNRPPAARRGGLNTGGIVFSLFFFAVASLFPIIFIPMGIESWQAHQVGAAIMAFFGAAVWALVWGGIGWIILFFKP